MKKTPLFVACDRGDLAEVNRLLAAGADPNESVHECGSPLGVAVVHCIREPRSIPRYPGSRGREMHPVATHVGIAKALLEHGAHLNGPSSSYGGTVLNDAAIVGSPALMEVLLADGRSSDVVGPRGRTPLFYVGMTSFEPDSIRNPGLGYDDALGTVRLLVKGGVPIDARDDEGRTALHEAARSGRPTAVQALISCGADVNVKDKNGLTALDAARTIAIEKAIREAGGRGLE